MKTFLETPRHKQNIIFSKYSSKLCLNESKMKKSKKKGSKTAILRILRKFLLLHLFHFWSHFLSQKDVLYHFGFRSGYGTHLEPVLWGLSHSILCKKSSGQKFFLKIYQIFFLGHPNEYLGTFFRMSHYFVWKAYY